MADLAWANLSGADFISTNLRRANLREAILIWTNLSETNLTRTDFSGTTIGGATIGGVDLSQTDCLEKAVHQTPSTIGVDTLIRTFRRSGDNLTPALAVFFQGAGVPKELLDALPRIVAGVVYYTCLISHGEPDKAFAEKLQESMRVKGVSCWIHEMDYTPGEPTMREIKHEMLRFDKVILVCSAPSLISSFA